MFNRSDELDEMDFCSQCGNLRLCDDMDNSEEPICYNCIRKNSFIPNTPHIHIEKPYTGPKQRLTRTLTPARQKVKQDPDLLLKVRAREAVRYALFKGEITKPDVCTLCNGNHGRIEGHHYNGYEQANWLVISWLCRRCHNTVHRALSNPLK